MNKTPLATFLLCLAAGSVRADLIWYEPFTYANGPIIKTGTNTDGSTNWFRHSGSANPSDALVANSKLQNSATGGTLSRQDDVHRPVAATAGSQYTNALQPLYASFTVNCTNLPNAAGTYIAHFMDNTTSNFLGRVFALVGSPGSSTPALNFTALPNTWRLGVSAASNNVNQVFPVDLALNTDYQVVILYDPVTLVGAQMWVNPLSASDTSLLTHDFVAPYLQTVILQALSFRQASSFGNAFFNITNLALATSFDDAATNVWSAAPVAPVVVYQPKNVSNYVGNPASLSIVAAGQGLAGLSYQWQNNGLNAFNPDGSTNVLNFASLSPSDEGPYTAIVSNLTSGLSATSAVAYVSVDTSPIPPIITQPPTNTTVYFGQTALLAVGATGPAPLYYQWNYNGNPINGATSNVLVIPNVQTNNATTGTYECDVTNSHGLTPSGDATLSAIPAPAVSIGYVRSLVDPTFFLPTNTTSLYTVTGIVTSYTNCTTDLNSEFFISDGTNGIAVFVVGGQGVRPQAGDSVTVTGPLGQFNSLLEMNLNPGADPSNLVITNSHNNLIPPGVVLPFNFTNSAAFGGVGNAIYKYQGNFITFTNVYFPAGFSGGKFAANGTITMTNQSGSLILFTYSGFTNMIGQPIPKFAWTVSGPLSFFLGNTIANRSSGYEFEPTRLDDFVTIAPAPTTATISLVGGQPVLSWLAQPYMSYTILRATDLNGPYTGLAPGLTFNTTAGQYTDTNLAPATRFYKIVSP